MPLAGTGKRIPEAASFYDTPLKPAYWPIAAHLTVLTALDALTCIPCGLLFVEDKHKIQTFCVARLP